MTSELIIATNPVDHGDGIYSAQVKAEDFSNLGTVRIAMTSNQAERVGVPELPGSVALPVIDDLIVVKINKHPSGYIGCPTGVECEWLSNLINAVYLPGGLRDRLEKAEARVRELEEQLKTR